MATVDPFLRLDYLIEEIQFNLNDALDLARECGDPEFWEELQDLIDNLEEAKDLLRIPESVEEMIWEAQNEEDYGY